MKCYPLQEAQPRLGGQLPVVFVDSLAERIPHLLGPYAINADSGVKTSLARQLIGFVEDTPDLFILIDNWGVWPSAENRDLFHGYRASLGETRPIWEAPVHVFAPGEDAAMMSILCLGLYFVWDVYVFDPAESFLMTFSHDEWMEFRVRDKDNVQFMKDFAEWFGLKPLRTKQP